MKKELINRITLIFILFGVAFVVIFRKGFYLQVINNKKLVNYSNSQFFRKTTVYPNRGNIYDRNGDPLAINIKTYSIFSIPKNISDKNTYSKLSKIVPELSPSMLEKKTKNRKVYTWLARKIKLSVKQLSRIKKLKGIHIEQVSKRFYPNSELLSQAMGFVGVDNSGLSGVEYLFNSKLKGESKVIKYMRDAKGRPVKFVSHQNQKEGQDIHLTIDKGLQSFAENALEEAVKNSNSDQGGIGIINPTTGEILAIANYPSFDPNNIKFSITQNHKLSFVTDPFEPGSIFKILTVASALENKIARYDTNYYCEQGKLRVEDHTIKEAEQHKEYDWLSVADIIKYSSNIGTTKIAFDLTYPKFEKTLINFGIGKKTGVEIPGESRGIFNPSKNVSPLRLSNMSFGQGIATTGIQMLSTYATIANNGVYVRPTIIKNKKSKGKRVLSKEVSGQLKQMLQEAVEYGTGKNAIIPHFQIAGKTSTAQRPDEKGGYTGHVPGFIGFPLGMENNFVIYVYVDNPKVRNYYGNSIAAPIFKKVAQYLIYGDKSFSKYAKNTLETKNKFDTVKMRRSSTRLKGHKMVPDLIGLDKRSVSKLLKRLKLKSKSVGIGMVASQTPPPGTATSSKTVLNLIYSPPSYED